jgi:hypothetical protein
MFDDDHRNLATDDLLDQGLQSSPTRGHTRADIGDDGSHLVLLADAVLEESALLPIQVSLGLLLVTTDPTIDCDFPLLGTGLNDSHHPVDVGQPESAMTARGLDMRYFPRIGHIPDDILVQCEEVGGLIESD